MLYVGWRINFLGINGDSYQIDIYRTPGSSPGVVRSLYGASEPFTTQEEASDDVFLPIRQQTGYIRFVTDRKNIIAEIMPDGPFDRLVRVLRGTTNPVCVWQGYVKQQIFTQPIGDYRWQIELPVVSMLGALKNAYPKMRGQTWVSIGSVITRALAAISTDIDTWPATPFTSFQYDNLFTGAKVYLESAQVVTIPTQTIPLAFTRLSCDWDDLAVRFNELFFSLRKKQEGDIIFEYYESDSYYTIIKKLLQPFGLVMRERGTAIHIHQYQMKLTSNAVEISEDDLEYRSDKRDVSLSLPAQTCAVTFELMKDDVELKLMTLPSVQMNSEPIFREDFGQYYENTQYHDPSNYEHPDEEFHFFHNTVNDAPPPPASYVDSDFETFLNGRIGKYQQGKYNVLGACYVLTSIPNATEEEPLKSALLIVPLWSATPSDRKIVYTKKTSIVTTSALGYYFGVLTIETIQQNELSGDNYTLDVIIENNGQYYSEGGSDNWVDTVTWVRLTITHGKVVPNVPNITDKGYIFKLEGRSGEVKIHIGAIHPNASSYGNFPYPLYITKFDLTLFDANIVRTHLNGYGDDRNTNEYHTGKNFAENSKTIQTHFGTCMGNVMSPSFIYVPHLSYAEAERYTSCPVMMAMYNGTVGSENYFECVPELLLLSMMQSQNETKRESRSMTVVPFLDMGAVYKIGTKYYIAIEQKRNWIDEQQKIKFLEIAPIRG